MQGDYTIREPRGVHTKARNNRQILASYSQHTTKGTVYLYCSNRRKKLVKYLDNAKQGRQQEEREGTGRKLPYSDTPLYTKDSNGQYSLWKEDRPLLTRITSFLRHLRT